MLPFSSHTGHISHNLSFLSPYFLTRFPNPINSLRTQTHLPTELLQLQHTAIHLLTSSPTFPIPPSQPNTTQTSLPQQSLKHLPWPAAAREEPLARKSPSSKTSSSPLPVLSTGNGPRPISPDGSASATGALPPRWTSMSHTSCARKRLIRRGGQEVRSPLFSPSPFPPPVPVHFPFPFPFTDPSPPKGPIK